MKLMEIYINSVKTGQSTSELINEAISGRKSKKGLKINFIKTSHSNVGSTEKPRPGGGGKPFASVCMKIHV
jgi:ASC-1-like (ASCH) protein